MKTATQTMTGFDNLEAAQSKAVELSVKYDQAFLVKVDPVKASVAYNYIIFTHLPLLHSTDTFLGTYIKGQLINQQN